VDVALRQFRQAVEAFCSMIEDSQDGDLRSYARRARNAVAGVYLAAALLPPTVLPEDDPAVPAGDLRRSQALEASIRDVLGADDTFVDIWDPTEPDDPIQRTLAGELVEIYEDLREALWLLDTVSEDGLWEIEFAFENHWGKHAVDVLRPLHLLAVRG
jgi:hypothetical protein